MFVFIPLAFGQSIPLQVIRSISEQDGISGIVPCSSLGVFKSNHNECRDGAGKLAGELASRNLIGLYLKMFYKEINDKYIAVQDRDIIHLYNDNYKLCVEYLDTNPLVEAVALPWRISSCDNHIRNAAFVIRRKVAENYIYRIDKRRHICVTMQEDLNYIYLPTNSIRIEEYCNI